MLRRTWLPALLAFSLASPDRRRLPADDTLLLRMPTVSGPEISRGSPLTLMITMITFYMMSSVHP